jgi:thioredoxin reductase (NADPH)
MADSPRNVIVIGSGPAGYTAAVYAARASLEPLVFEGAVTAGGALMNTTEVENFPGFRDGIQGPALMDEMRAQAERFGAELVADDVTEVDLTGELKVVRTAEATFLSRFGSKVTLIHRRDELRGSKIMQDRAQADPKIEFAWNSEVAQIHGEDQLTGLTLRDTTTGETRELPATGLFIAIGHDPRSELLTGQVDLDDEGYVLVEGRSTRTNLPGVFACGDLVDHTYRQAVTAAGSGCAAALDAERHLAALDHADATATSAAALA